MDLSHIGSAVHRLMYGTALICMNSYRHAFS